MTLYIICYNLLSKLVKSLLKAEQPVCNPLPCDIAVIGVLKKQPRMSVK